jgi:DNA-binding transcriptional LysR family regulator
VIRLDDLEAFVAIVEAGRQTAAARRLGRSLQSVARSLAAVEAASGVELIRRNTRRSQPTEAGRAFLLRVAPALVEIEAAKREAAAVGAEPSACCGSARRWRSVPRMSCRWCARSWRAIRGWRSS